MSVKLWHWWSEKRCLNSWKITKSQFSITLEVDLNRSQISRIQKNIEKIIEEWQNSNPDRKRKWVSKSEDTEDALLCQFSQAHNHQILLSDPCDRKSWSTGTWSWYGWFQDNQWVARKMECRQRNPVRNAAWQKAGCYDFGAERWVTEVLRHFNAGSL